MKDGMESAYEDAFRQVIAHRTMLRAYIQAIVRDPVLTEDTLSDVSVEIARGWGRFDRSREFAPWARGVARRVALANLRSRGAEPLSLADEVLDAVGAEIDSMGDEVRLQTRKAALEECVGGLSEANRQLVRLRYFENATYRRIAKTVGRRVDALYMAFSRIHAALGDCIDKRLESA